MATTTMADATATATHNGQLTVTVTSAADSTGGLAADTASSTLSLIYVWSTSASSQATETASSSRSSNRVSGGVIAGIVVGSIAFLVLLSLILFCYSRKIARRRRAEIASLHPSRTTGASRAHSRATTTAQGTVNGTYRNSQYARSLATSTRTGAGTVTMSLKSPSPMPSYPPPAELPTPHNRSQSRHRSQSGVRLVHVKRKTSRPEVAEMYGSFTHPVELHGGSNSDLMKRVAEMKREEAAAIDAEERGGSTNRRDRDSDLGSSRYMTPEPGWHSSAGPGSDGTETEYGGTEYGTATDGASIHIYYRNSAATIAQAMSQASFRSSQKPPPRSAMRSGSIPLSSQTSLAETAR